MNTEKFPRAEGPKCPHQKAHQGTLGIDRSFQRLPEIKQITKSLGNHNGLSSHHQQLKEDSNEVMLSLLRKNGFQARIQHPGKLASKCKGRKGIFRQTRSQEMYL